MIVLVCNARCKEAAVGKMVRTYHDKNATMKPSQEKKKVRPYLSKGLSIGMERALRFNGLTSGADHSIEALNGMVAVVVRNVRLVW